MAYNSAKRLYTIHNRESHTYLSDKSYIFGDFCDCQLFDSLFLAQRECEILNSDKLEILEIEITKWSCKEILDV